MRQIFSGVTIGLLMLCCVTLFAAPSESGPDPSSTTVTIGFSKTLFSDVNINDALASIEVWADTIARSKGIPMEMKVEVFDTTDLLEAALVEGNVDLVGLLTPEVLDIGGRVALDHFYGTEVRQTLAEEYLILVQDQADYTDVAQLAGTTLKALNNGRCSLASSWLDLLLQRQGVPARSVHFDNIQLETKANMVILPVFFGTAEACLVTRNSFETMTELNPQVGRKLRVIAQSPPYVPAVFCFRAGFQSEFKDKILEGLDELHTQPSGAQVLIVFRGDRLLRMAENDLESARLLLARLAE